MGKEAYDDYKRHLRDREANSQKYLILVPPRSHNPDSGPHTRSVPSSSLRVGDLVILEKNQRVPADMVLLRTSDPSGTCFIRTDQLDGETDWKLRVAAPATQKLGSDRELMMLEGEVYGEFCTCLNLLTGGKYPRLCFPDELFSADSPIKDIHTFVGTLTINNPPSPSLSSDPSSPASPLAPSSMVEPLTAENVVWSNTVLAAGSAVGFVVYTGQETRAVMNTSHPGTKVGLLDLEINGLAKVSVTVVRQRGSDLD